MPKFGNGKRFFRNPDTGRFERYEEHEDELAEELLEESDAEATDGDGDLSDIWQAIAGELDPIDLKEFVELDNAVELFRAGWVDMGDETADAREQFFELMEQYDISRDEFDWDAWRDWYEDA